MVSPFLSLLERHAAEFQMISIAEMIDCRFAPLIVIFAAKEAAYNFSHLNILIQYLETSALSCQSFYTRGIFAAISSQYDGSFYAPYEGFVILALAQALGKV
jgi:hypothetical protein